MGRDNGTRQSLLTRLPGECRVARVDKQEFLKTASGPAETEVLCIVQGHAERSGAGVCAEEFHVIHEIRPSDHDRRRLHSPEPRYRFIALLTAVFPYGSELGEHDDILAAQSLSFEFDEDVVQLPANIRDNPFL
ncbi:hypothetical protein D9M72_276020 [compost metagenome]